MSIFKSKNEKLYWIGCLAVLLTILTSLFLPHSAQLYFLSQDVQAILFVSGMFLVTVSVLRYGTRNTKDHLKTALILCGTTILLMVIFRLGAPERSHLMEYTILTLLIHLALTERYKTALNNLKVGLKAFVIASLIGLIDELIQLIIPERTFDKYDIIFNILAALFAVSTILILQLLKKVFRKKTNRSD